MECRESAGSESSSARDECWENTLDTRLRPGPSSNLDGTEDTSDTTAERRRASAGQATELTPVEKILVLSGVETRSRGHTVSDRIRVLNSKRNPSSGNAIGVNKRERSNNPFVRRDASTAPAVVDSPINRSPFPLQPPKILAPCPRKMMPALSPALERATPTLDVLRDDTQMNDVESRVDGRSCSYLDAGKTQPSLRIGAIPGQVMCSRHGRRLVPKRGSRTATTEGMDRGFNGAYLPSSRRLRHQVDSTSPWHVLAKSLTKQEGTSISPDICPDCLAEQDIKRREDLESSRYDGPTSTDPNESRNDLDRASIMTEPGTPVLEEHRNATIVGSSTDHQIVGLPGAAVSGLPQDHVGTVVAADLGNIIDAIIIEHRGTLDRVITNMRGNTSQPDKLQQLSEELARVSKAVSSIQSTKIYVLPQDHQVPNQKSGYSIILDTPPEFLRTRTKSIPDLIEYIDSAARDLGLGETGGKDHEEVDDGGPSNDETEYGILTEHYVEQSTFIPPSDFLTPRSGPYRAKSTRSRWTTAQASPSASPSLLGAKIPGAMSALTLPEVARPSEVKQAITTPISGNAATGHVGTPNFERGKAPDTETSRKPIDEQDIRQATPRNGLDSAVPDFLEPPKTTAQQTTVPIEPILASTECTPDPTSRIPGLKRTSSTPRRYIPGGLKLPAAPWSKADTVRPAPLKPSQVKEQQKQQGTFQQPWLVNAVKDKAWVERIERRRKLGEEGGAKK